VRTSAQGLVTVTGGKLTTYRRMAADTVDAALAQLGQGGRQRRRSPTRRLRLHGAEARPGSAADAHLHSRFGGEAPRLAALASQRPEWGAPLVPGLPYLGVEAVWAAREEMALTLEDVLARRTRALLLDREATARAAPGVADLLAPELGWDGAERERQLSSFLQLVEAERAANRAPV
jgi:glycerol-3-phosphate dehydrogenase